MRGSDIRRVRKARGLSQVALAEQLGLHPQTVSRWETGQMGLRRTSILALCAMLPELGKVESKSSGSRRSK